MGTRRRDGTGRPQAAPRWQSLLEGHRGGLITAAIVVAVVLLVGLGTWAAARDTAEASDFRVQLYRGADVLGSSEVNFADVLAQGKPVILNFWGGSCPPCRFEMPALQRTYEGHRDEVTLLGLDVGIYFGLGTRRTALALLDELDITYPSGAPTDDGPVRGFGVTGLPTTVFFDSRGKAVRRWEGVITAPQLESIIAELR
jgi:thiol-disulfide isomerase/thioredoxin